MTECISTCHVCMALGSRTHDIVPPACFFAVANSASRDSSTCTHHARVENQKGQTERIRFNLLSQKHLVVLLILGQSVEQPTRTNQGRVAFFQLLHLATVYTQLHMDANSSPHAPHQSPRIHGYVGQNRHLPCRPTYPKHDSCKARSDEHIGLHHERANSNQRLRKLLHGNWRRVLISDIPAATATLRLKLLTSLRSTRSGCCSAIEHESSTTCNNIGKHDVWEVIERAKNARETVDIQWSNFDTTHFHRGWID